MEKRTAPTSGTTQAYSYSMPYEVAIPFLTIYPKTILTQPIREDVWIYTVSLLVAVGSLTPMQPGWPLLGRRMYNRGGYTTGSNRLNKPIATWMGLKNTVLQ